jgi:hypothetical protein
MGHLAARYRDASRSGVYRVTDGAVPRAAALEAGPAARVLILEGLDSPGNRRFPGDPGGTPAGGERLYKEKA